VPAPLYGLLVATAASDATAMRGRRAPPISRVPGIDRIPRLPRALWLLAALLISLWPHALYVARRFVDGSDEPWGVLALLTVIALCLRDRLRLEQPTRAALVASCTLAVAAAVAHLVLPDLAAAALAMLALAVYLAHALRRPAGALAILLLLALPLIASLQFYLGYPLRLLVAQASAGVLWLGGLEVQAAGASIVHAGSTVLIDAPCAGIGMLWLGSYVAALLSYLHGADGWQTARNGMLAALLVLLANIARNTVLFFPEAGLVQWPAWSHEAVGLVAVAAAIGPLALFISANSRSHA
jgi:exosortase/archaeosortase family protein